MGKWQRRAWLRTSAWAVFGSTLIGACRRITQPAQAATAHSVNKREPAARERAVAEVFRPGNEHWVGDGFWVRTVFSPFQVDAETISPFLLLDHGAPRLFDPARAPRGVGAHPHRGFETVTFAYQGEVDHRDSAGGGGRILPGDVQWMTAASGVVHEEKHSAHFTSQGGTLEMVQLWVNLPAARKMSHPRYQALKNESFGRTRLGAATARVIAGGVEGVVGPAKTHSPIAIFDLVFDEPGETSFSLDPEHTLLMVALTGAVTLANDVRLPARHLAVFERGARSKELQKVIVRGEQGAKVLVLSGQPLGEPVVAHGPFVMNSREEIAEAIRDYQAGKMGALRPTETKSS